MSGKAQVALEKLEAAIKRLAEALKEGRANPLFIDGTIQRFEFVFELAWKAIQYTLGAEGITCTSPKDAIKKAFGSELIDDELLWLQMLDDRNRSSHTYDEISASEIYDRIGAYHAEFEKLAIAIRSRMESSR